MMGQRPEPAVALLAIKFPPAYAVVVAGSVSVDVGFVIAKPEPKL
jgi:hypothetical protein